MDLPNSIRSLIKSAIHSSRRKEEWLELRLPAELAGLEESAWLGELPIPSKLSGRLLADGGISKKGKQVRLHLFPREEPEYLPVWLELDILYEDDFSLVVNKPAGLEVYPNKEGQKGTLAHAVSAYYATSGQSCRIRHIHRLDKETSGPVLYAKNEFAHLVFDHAMREKRIERIYVAIAEGVIKPSAGTIDQPIGRDRHHATRRRVSQTGNRAVTQYEVLARYPDHTLVRLMLETGRTHQVRVHLSAIGHPLAGDDLYGGSKRLIDRQALHGEKLIWLHPWTDEQIAVHAPMPDDISRLIEHLNQSNGH